MPHIYAHEVVEAEVDEVLSHAGEDRPGRNGSRVAIGKTSGGRYLRVIYIPGPRASQCLCSHGVWSNREIPGG